MHLLACVMAAVLAAAALFTGCSGGAKKAAPNDWVADVCTAAKTLSDQRAASLLAFFEVDSEDGQAMYDGFNRYSETYGKALDDFTTAANKAGQPTVKDGGKVRKAVQQWANDEKAANTNAQTKVSKLDRASEHLAADINDIFFAIQFADLKQLLQTSGAVSAGDVIQLIEKDSQCAFALFAE